MLPSDLNKLVGYLEENTSIDKQHIGKLLYLIEDNNVRSRLLIAISKIRHATKNNRKPCLHIAEYISTDAEHYLEEKLVITAYYTDHVQHYILGNLIDQLRSKSGYDCIVFEQQYQPPMDRNVKSGVKNRLSIM